MSSSRDPRDPAEPAAPRPSGKLAVLASVVPFFVGTSCCLLVPFLSASDASVTRLVQETGLAFYVLALSAPLCATSASVLVGLAATGRRVPSALAIFVATIPWQVGIASSRFAFYRVESAVAFADPSERATLIARGTAEAMNGQILGAGLSAGLLTGVGLGLALAAFLQRAPSRSLLGLAAALLALPLVAEAGWLATEGLAASVTLVLVSLAAVLTTALAAASIGADAPRYRSGALAAASVASVGLGFVAAAACAATLSTRSIFGAIAMVSVVERLTVLAAAVRELAPFRFVAGWGALAALLPVLAVAVVALVKGRASAGRIGGGVAVALAAAIAVALELTVAGIGASSAVERPAWSTIEGFEPMVIDRASDVTPLDIGTVTTDALIGPSGERASLASRPELVAAMQPLLQTDVRSGSWDLAPPEPPDPTLPEAGPYIALAIDQRVTGAPLRNVIEAAGEAGAHTLVLVGSGARVDAATLDTVTDALPSLAMLAFASTYAEVRLPAALSDAYTATDPFVYHATISRAADVVVTARPGATPASVTLGAPDAWDVDTVAALDGKLVYLLLPETATAGDLAGAVSRVDAFSGRPQLVLDRFPAAAETTSAPATPPADVIDLLGALQGDGIGVSDVLGSGGLGLGGSEPAPGTLAALDRTIIQRVIRRSQPQMRRCYEETLTRDPSAAGRVTVALTIGPSGAVETAAVTSSTIGDAELESCLLARVRSLRFPAAPGVTNVTYPFVFAASE